MHMCPYILNILLVEVEYASSTSEYFHRIRSAYYNSKILIKATNILS